jgi:hypothetical protein
MRKRMNRDSLKNVASRITGGPTTRLFEATVLQKYEVTYFRCNETGFIQTEEPFWLAEAYSNAISDMDVGLVARNLRLAETAQRYIDTQNFKLDRFLDFGGGYGLFTRLMRDAGYPFLHFDSKCINLFAKSFEADPFHRREDTTFDLTTAWEVFEHLVDPLEVIASLLETSRQLLFSTVLIPTTPVTSPADWWYFMPQMGQHVSFYSSESLEHIASKFNCKLYTDNVSLHLLSHDKLRRHPFPQGIGPKLLWRASACGRRLFGQSHSRTSLTAMDFESAMTRTFATARERAS